MDPLLLEAIVCPQCRGDLRYTKEGVLVCLPCRVGYPAENGVPDLRIVAALPLKSKGIPTPKKRVVIDIRNEGGSFQSYLEPHTCRVIGRSSFDEGGTQIISAGGMIALDDGVKKIVTNFIKKQEFQRIPESQAGFERLPDIFVNDLGVSRLHAMIFFDGTRLGILDLVSRNGTFINEREVESAYVSEGDEVRLGNTRLKIQ